MANNGTFRSAINGFNRQDVLDYLESASQRYETLKKERNELDRLRTEEHARVRELETLREEADAGKEQALRELAEAQAQLLAGEKACEDLRAALEKMTAERDAALARPAEDPAAAQALRSEIGALKAQLAEIQAGQAETIQKAREYDSMRDRIATLELNASRRAADIEEAARTEARRLIDEARQQAQETAQKAEREAEALLDKAKEDEADFLTRKEENYRSFRESLQGAAQETEEGAGRIAEELQRLGEKLRGIVGALSDTALRFSPAPADEAEEPCCCGEADVEAAPEEDTEAAQEPREEAHSCHE